MKTPLTSVAEVKGREHVLEKEFTTMITRFEPVHDPVSLEKDRQACWNAVHAAARRIDHLEELFQELTRTLPTDERIGRATPENDGSGLDEQPRRTACPICLGSGALLGPLGVEPCGVCAGAGHVAEPPDPSVRRFWLMEIEPASGGRVDSDTVLTESDLRTITAALKQSGRPVLARRVERLARANARDLGESRICAGKWRRA